MYCVVANVAIPTIAGHLLVMVLLLFPVVAIEAVVLARRHLVHYRPSLGMALKANLMSTFVGLPMGYAFALLGVIPAGLFASLLPDDRGHVLSEILMGAVVSGGTIPSELDEISAYLGTLLVMVPYFLVTLRVERRSIAKQNPDLDTPRLATTVRLMNDITYGLLALPVVVGAVCALMRLAGS